MPFNMKVKIHGGFCPPNVTWRKEQTIHSLNDGSIVLVKFSSGDYFGLSTIQIANESIVSISKNETHQILQGTMGPRSGGATGYFVPSDDNDGNFERSHSISEAVRPDHLLIPSSGYGTQCILQYLNKKIVVMNSCYQDVLMTRNDTKQKRTLAMAYECLREKLLKEMHSRILFLMIAVHYKLDVATSLFTTLGKAVENASAEKQSWLTIDPMLTDYEIVLLEYACGTGEMRNHQALAAHVDKNRSHPVESMVLFGKVPREERKSDCEIVDDMQDGILYLPHEHLALKMRCGFDILHCSFKSTYHVADSTRGLSNWSYVHGP
jgi:hypothetical protein